MYQRIIIVKKIQVCSLVFQTALFSLSFDQSKRVVVYFYLPNSRFHWLLIVLFQEPVQDLTLFSFLEENCYIGWRTYKSAANTKRNNYFYSSVSKSVRRQENHYQWLRFSNLFWQKLLFVSRWTQWTAELLTRWFSSSYQIL